MKKTVATFCLFGATLALSACTSATTGNVDIAPPYDMERTAAYSEAAKSSDVVATPTRVAPAEQVFQKAQKK